MSTKAEKATQEHQAPVLENNDCFIIMPIADHSDYKPGHFKRVYQDIFAPACIAAGYRPVRADDVTQTNLIHLDILQKLIDSPMAICDLSSRNPNVLFELGLRQAFDKPTVIVQEEGTPKIFDIGILRYTEYHRDLDYRNVLQDQESIKKALLETKKAVAENKSVNSIIKLLSINAPAHLQDESNFGEKEYFHVLMQQFSRLDDKINQLHKPFINYQQTANSIINDADLIDLFRIDFLSDVPNFAVSNFVDYLNKLKEIAEVKFYPALFDRNPKPYITLRVLGRNFGLLFREAEKLGLDISITDLSS